jgi:nitric oxide reductase NorQ protein
MQQTQQTEEFQQPLVYREMAIEEYILTEEPFYLPVSDEIQLFEAAYEQRLPVLLKGPTGCGKTRFVEHMAYRLGRPLTVLKRGNTPAEDETVGGLPLVTVACHEDLTASDLVGRYVLEGEETKWIEGPLSRAVKAGAICYLDEIVEARKDTTVLIHPLTDHRRILPVEKRGMLIEAQAGFLLVISYNPGYQSAQKDLKHSTRQRFISIEFN